jgi:hypothetical protein
MERQSRVSPTDSTHVHGAAPPKVGHHGAPYLAPVQREASGEPQASDVPTRAARGVQGAGGKLPHLEQIQASFGRHDVGGVRAFVGGEAATAARSIGARAYAMGDAVAFAGAPDVRQAAHEAAHVVQQRGGVQLDGGVGAAGDPYERHADDVADKVVRGQSAESMLSLFGNRGGGPAVQRDPEPIAQLDQALAAAASGADLRPTLTAIDRFRPARHETRTELEVPIGGAPHHVAVADLATLRQHVLTRLTALGAIRDAAGERAIIDAGIEAVEANESGGRAVARQSTMDTSAPNPAEPGRGQHASYASASQMIVSHAIGALRGTPEGRAIAAEHGITAADLADANAASNASNSLWDAVVLEGWTYERLRADRGRDGHARELELTRFTEADIARMSQFGAFRRVLLAQRARVIAVRDEVTASLTTHGDEVEAEIAAMRAEPAPTPAPRRGRAGHGDADAGAGGDHDAGPSGGDAATGPGGDAATPTADTAPTATSPTAPAPTARTADSPTAPTAPAPTARTADTAPAATSPTAPADAPAEDAAAVATEVHAALGLLDADLTDQVAGIRGFARPAGWATMTAAQRRTWLGGATTRLHAARGKIHHVACAAADALVAHEVADDPAVTAMGFGAATVRAYIHSEAHFLQRFPEDRGGWARLALQNHAIAPAADGTPRSLDSAIADAAAAGGGHRLTRADLEGHMRAYLRAHPFASPEDVIRCAADTNSGRANDEYRATILGHFHRLHPDWAAEHPAAGAAPAE